MGFRKFTRLILLISFCIHLSACILPKPPLINFISIEGNDIIIEYNVKKIGNKITRLQTESINDMQRVEIPFEILKYSISPQNKNKILVTVSKYSDKFQGSFNIFIGFQNRRFDRITVFVKIDKKDCTITVIDEYSFWFL
ncbi:MULTISPECIES: hypothetical protein [unclassified Treponema]|uniref:hypothetical protein n=1 Tax=unclassified Treponema TaxID=2638727 RepID=UPI0020A4F392|nr:MULTISPECIES: hypothetical protein [unclassified Treponema]UTC42958.1 hypothetical protein E4N66_01855 [Treponema sp. OMZ 857]UTC50397.1 hypothetical protein E4N65_10010 [Treponema sp. OMZ 855]